MKEAPLLGLLAAALLGCQGVPAGGQGDSRSLDAAPASLAAELLWSRPFGAEGEVPAALIVAGPERLAALTDQAVYRLDLEGRVLSRAPLPEPARGAGGVSGLSWDGSGLALALRWRGDATAPAGGYLGFADEEGALAPGRLVPVAPAGAPLRSSFDGEAHVLVWMASGAGTELRAARVTRDGEMHAELLEAGLGAGLALGELRARPGELCLCSLDNDGGVSLRCFRPAGSAAVAVGTLDRPGIGPCRLASSGRSQLLAWRGRALPPPEAGIAGDGGLRVLSFDEPLARAVSPGGTPAAGPLVLSQQSGTFRLESLLWDGARYLVLLAGAGQRGGRLFLAALDEGGRLLARDLLLPIEVEPALLLPAALVAGPADYYLLYGLRRPWDAGILYLARLRLG